MIDPERHAFGADQAGASDAQGRGGEEDWPTRIHKLLAPPEDEDDGGEGVLSGQPRETGGERDL